MFAKIVTALVFISIVFATQSNRPIPPNFFGTFVHERSENLDEYLYESGIGWAIRFYKNVLLAVFISPKVGRHDLDHPADQSEWRWNLQARAHHLETTNHVELRHESDV